MQIAQEPAAADITKEPSAADPYDHRARLAYADAFRAAAIFAVAAAHVMVRLLPAERYGKVGVVFGAWGVDCFFVLSGFLLARPYLEAILGTRPFPSSKLFFARRFYRIWPLYAAAVVFSALGQGLHHTHHVALADVLTHLTMTHNFFPQYISSSFNGPLWTMPVDTDFYLLLPLTAVAVVGLTKSLGSKQRVTLLFSLCAAATIGSLILRAVLGALFTADIDDIPLYFTLFRNVFGMAGPFAVGIALGLLAVLRVKVPRPAVAGALGAGIVLGLVLFVIPQASWFAGTFYDVIGALSAGLLLFACLRGAVPAADALVRSKPVVSLAALAYAVYLFHEPVMNAIYNALGGHKFGGHYPLLFDLELSLGMLLGTLAVAIVAHNLIEQPFLRRKDALRETAA